MALRQQPRRQRSNTAIRMSSSLGNGSNEIQRLDEEEELVMGDRRRSLLDDAFSSLTDIDKYETVLVGLCAKIIEDGSEKKAQMNLGDPLSLLGEMNDRGIRAGPRGIVSLVDATALASDARIMADVLSLSKRNGAITRYGTLQNDIDLVPRSPDGGRSMSSSSSSFSYGGGRGGDWERKIRKLASLPPVPDDDRAMEVTQAVVFGALITVCVGLNVIGGVFHTLEDCTPWTNLFLGIVTSVVIIDNSFDVLVGTTQTLTNLNKDKIPTMVSKTVQSIPPKEDMPLGIGTGIVSGSIVRGLTRLSKDDTERDCMCEAAAVYIAYVLGLPCFAFRPNANEGATLVLQSTMGENDVNSRNRDHGRWMKTTASMSSLASDVGLLKVLIWLLAPVAMELSRYPQLLSSEPREASSFLQRLVDTSSMYSSSSTTSLAEALPMDDTEVDTYLRWALAEADALLRKNVRVVDRLSEALAGGAATVGDCVAILEEW